MRMLVKKIGLCAVSAVFLLGGGRIYAADHADAPLVGFDQSSDINDLYAFVDPNDNTRVVLAFDVHGFIVPGENSSFGGFDPRVLYQFNIENTGDAKADLFIKVKFSAQISRSDPQIATITIRGRDPHGRMRFKAPTTVPSSTSEIAPMPVVTTDQGSGIQFFAGLTDDPFFFDIPGFGRFVASVLAGSPEPNELNRGRDSFAGYNVQMIALSVPVDLLLGSAGDTLGISATTLRHRLLSYSDKRDPLGFGTRIAVDRMGIPAVNVALTPFARKNEYNRADTQDDAAGRFANDIVSTLTALGTDAAHIGILADVAVTRGDQLRLDTSISNAGSQGGTNPNAGFPNGRRPADDVIDTILFLVTNEALSSGDNVDANDVAFLDSFPFFAPAQQPFPIGTLDDNTRN